MRKKETEEMKKNERYFTREVKGIKLRWNDKKVKGNEWLRSISNDCVLGFGSGR